MRAVLDPNVLISALLSGTGAPAEILRRWRRGDIELVTSVLLIDELARALVYPKIRRRIAQADGDEFVALLRVAAPPLADPDELPPAHSADPDDDYLIALASHSRSVLVSGDRHLLELADRIPIMSPREFLNSLG